MLMQITVKPGIYGICDKIWGSMLKFFNCYQTAQLNCKFKRLAVSPQVHELAGENHANNCREIFFTLINECTRP